MCGPDPTRGFSTREGAFFFKAEVEFKVLQCRSVLPGAS